MITLTAIYWPRRYPTAALRARALRLMAEGLKSTTIARELGVHPNTVLNWRNAARKAREPAL